jgi:pimeloyl-ACP methyl ester carboxylesterase
MNTNQTVTQYLQRPEGRIGYDVIGARGAPLVLCVPGMGIVRSEFRFTVPALVAAGYRVATMDLRGHGNSDTTFDRLEDVATASDIVPSWSAPSCCAARSSATRLPV